MLVGGCEVGAEAVSGSEWTRQEVYARGMMFRTAEGGKSAFVGSRPGMVAARCGLWWWAWLGEVTG